MVPVDMALWRLYAIENGFNSFDELIPGFSRPSMTYRHDKLGLIPLITYGTQPADIQALAGEGAFLFKIKIFF